MILNSDNKKTTAYKLAKAAIIDALDIAEYQIEKDYICADDTKLTDKEREQICSYVSKIRNRIFKQLKV